MVTILDYRASEPSNVQGKGVLPGGVPIPALISTTAAGTQVADLGMFWNTTTADRVELNATIGVRGDTGRPEIAVIILRDGVQIFASQQGLEADSERFYTIAVDAVDFNVAAGFHHYQLFVVNLQATTTASVVGPVVFTGTAYALS